MSNTYKFSESKSIVVAALLVVMSIIILSPMANALTPRSDFSDNVSTQGLFGGAKVCGDHLCKFGEWNKWLNNLFSNQVKKFNDLFGIKNPSSNSIKGISYNAKSLPDTSSGYITRINTINIGDGRFTSFVSVTNNGVNSVNHITISQSNPDVKTFKAWISPQWESSISLYQINFYTSKSSLPPKQTLNIVIITDGKPAFSLDSLGTSIPK